MRERESGPVTVIMEESRAGWTKRMHRDEHLPRRRFKFSFTPKHVQFFFCALGFGSSQAKERKFYLT